MKFLSSGLLSMTFSTFVLQTYHLLFKKTLEQVSIFMERTNTIQSNYLLSIKITLYFVLEV